MADPGSGFEGRAFCGRRVLVLLEGEGSELEVSAIRHTAMSMAIRRTSAKPSALESVMTAFRLSKSEIPRAVFSATEALVSRD